MCFGPINLIIVHGKYDSCASSSQSQVLGGLGGGSRGTGVLDGKEHVQK